MGVEKEMIVAATKRPRNPNQIERKDPEIQNRKKSMRSLLFYNVSDAEPHLS